MATDPYLPAGDPDDQVPPTPISFKIMVVLAVIYLGWRLIEGVAWVVNRLS